MLFLWTTTKLGKIWVDGDAIKLIISKRLPQELYVQEISFIGEKNLLNAYIAAPEDTNLETKSALERRFEGIFNKSGIAVQLNWVNIAPQDNRKTTPVWMLPLFGPPRPPASRRFSTWASGGYFGQSSQPWSDMESPGSLSRTTGRGR